MGELRKTAIVTGASRGMGAELVRTLVERGYNVVANSRKITQSTEVQAGNFLALVDGDIGMPATAAKIVETALRRFKSIDLLVNDAGIIFNKPFTDYAPEDFKSIVSTNLEGFLYITQLSIKQMLVQKTGGSIVTITAALTRNPIRGVTASIPMITKGGLETVTRHLAIEYAADRIRVNAVAPGVVYTPLQRNTPIDVMQGRSPMGAAIDRERYRGCSYVFDGCGNGHWRYSLCRWRGSHGAMVIASSGTPRCVGAHRAARSNAVGRIKRARLCRSANGRLNAVLETWIPGFIPIGT